jgi:acyl transferase domain-containing protein/SAM-dependent methyltransferase
MDPRGTAAGAEALTPVKRALLEIRELKAQLAEARGALREPIAIVGVGLRLPGGVRDLPSLEALLWSGRDAVTEIPASRWSLAELYDADPDAPGKMTTRHGAFLDGVDRFDAEFFGISPREADSMDPQQRLLLEVSWNALEDAAWDPGALAGTRLGVYVGISGGDYGRALFAAPEELDVYASTGNSLSVAAGRLSYFLGVHGPAVSVDTACSSSLVALHLACQGLRQRDCDRAVVGGVNVILTPELNIAFSKGRMMAADGRCKTFDAAADGYVRGEGCCVLALRRLSDAVAAGDRILAVVRGSAVNQDGRSGGLTAPSGPAQEAVLRAALEAAGVPPTAVGYVEAHGTGTSLGDPIEVGALAAVLCDGRDPARPLLLGSVKTNLGHLEAAAGLAGVAKVLAALRRREIPPHLHFTKGNPHIDWTRPIAVPTVATPFAAVDGRRVAGVSAFGFSGTNAHALLEEPPAPASAPAASVGAGAPAAPERPLHLLALSARDAASLGALARAWEERLGAPGDAGVADLCFTAGAGRAHLAQRLAVVGATAEELRRALAAHREGAAAPAVATGRSAGAARPQVAFLFTGQGAQHPGMGKGLYETAPAFRRVLDACDEKLRPLLPGGRGLRDLLFAPADRSEIHRSAFAQPATFAVEVALAALWRSWGIQPVAVLGHSLGEYAAACAAGALSLDDGLRLVAERGRLMEALPEGGAMAAAFAAEDVVAAEVARAGGEVTLAAYNAPQHQVLSGRREAVEAVSARLAAAGVEVKRLHVAHAAHSHLVEPALPGLRRALESVRFQEPRVALVSNLTGQVAGLDTLGHPEYWLAHLRQPVRFAPSIETLVALGVTHFVEVGPHPVLLGIGAECAPGGGREWLASLRRDRPDWTDLLESLQRLYVGGADVDWAGFDRDHPRRRAAAPAYPFHGRRHWVDRVGQPAAARAGEGWARVGAALDREAERGPLGLDAASYPAKWDVLARLTSASAQRVLAGAGVFARAGERRTVDEVLAGAHLGERYRHLVARWLDGLVARGALRRDGEAWIADAPLAAPDLAPLEAEADRLLADNPPLLAYVRHCATLLPGVIAGAVSPLETLFPSGSFDLAEALYERSSTMRYANGLAAAAFEALAAGLPQGRALRVLEIGAGTGGTTSSVLAALAGARCRYTFTDVSDLFLERGRTRFGDRPWVEFRRLDLDEDPAAQGFAPGSFDAVVSANAVHATKDLRAAVARIRGLLAPGGAVVLVESTTHFEYFDMTTGLIEGWQHFADDLRHENPLLPPERWVALLRESGFEVADAWPRPASAAATLGQHLVVACAPGAAVGGAEAAPHAAAADPAAARAADERQPPDEGAAFRQRILDALPPDRTELLREYVRDRVVRVLRLAPDQVPGRDERLMDMGFDSLMAVQLRNLLGAGLALEKPLPASTMFDHPTIDALAARLLALVAPAASPAPAAASAAAAPRPARKVDEAAVAGMSDAEVEALLLEKLEGR